LSFIEDRPLFIVGPFSAILKRSIYLRNMMPSGFDVVKASKKIKSDFVDYSIKNEFPERSSGQRRSESRFQEVMRALSDAAAAVRDDVPRVLRLGCVVRHARYLAGAGIALLRQRDRPGGWHNRAGRDDRAFLRWLDGFNRSGFFDYPREHRSQVTSCRLQGFYPCNLKPVTCNL